MPLGPLPRCCRRTPTTLVPLTLTLHHDPRLPATLKAWRSCSYMAPGPGTSQGPCPAPTPRPAPRPGGWDRNNDVVDAHPPDRPAPETAQLQEDLGDRRAIERSTCRAEAKGTQVCLGLVLADGVH